MGGIWGTSPLENPGDDVPPPLENWGDVPHWVEICRNRDERGREPEEEVSQDKDEEEVEDIYCNITEGGESVIKEDREPEDETSKKEEGESTEPHEIVSVE